MLGSEGMMNIAEGIELIEYNVIADSDRRGYLIASKLKICFDEELNNKQEIRLRSLNHNKRTDRKGFIETCDFF